MQQHVCTWLKFSNLFHGAFQFWNLSVVVTSLLVTDDALMDALLESKSVGTYFASVLPFAIP